ncbi:MAG: KpsF/GutQ family sugar-phosphate isomerase [Planctomycetota bacterium]
MLRLKIPEIVDSPQQQLQMAREVLDIESRTLAEVSGRLGNDFLQAVALVFKSPGSVIVTGIGKAGHVGQKVAATLASTGTPAHFLHPAEAVHGDLGRVSSDDVVLAFSHSGQTDELLQILPTIKDIGASLVAITSRRSSRLAGMADVAVIYGNVQEACPIGLAPSTSCSVMMGIGDALAFVLMRMRAFGDEDFGRFHPAGSLGKKLKSVDEIMRTGDQLRVAESSQPVHEVFVRVQRPGRRTGAIMLVDENGCLEGIFTDSDLARLFERREFSAFDRPIREFMSRHPLAMRTGQRVLEALTLIKDYQFSEIPVLDERNRPIGIIDITDLVDLLPEGA